MRLTHISPAALARLIVLGIAALGSASSAATLNGTVGDPSARGIPEASVKAANFDTNIVSSTVSDGSGLYVIPNLPPGTYRLTVQKDGFKTIIRPGVVLHTDTVVEINFTMEVGSLTQSVTIEAGAPIVDLASATISGNVNNQEVLSLPLNARS